MVAGHRPDVVLMGGWAERPYRELVWNDELNNCRMIFGDGYALEGDASAISGAVKIGKYIDRLDGIFVPGERGMKFAQHLKMPAERIFPGMLGFDYRLFEGVMEKRLGAPWPKRFVYLGRYSLRRRWMFWRRVTRFIASRWLSPGRSVVMVLGAMQYLIGNQAGVEVNGWVHPADQPEVLLRQGVSVADELD